MGKGSAGRFLWACVLYMVVGGGCGFRVGWGAAAAWGGGAVSIFPWVLIVLGEFWFRGGTGHWAIIL